MDDILLWVEITSPEESLKMVTPSEESIEAAMECNMNVVGAPVRSSTLKLFCKEGCSARNSLIVLNGEKIHVSAEVNYLIFSCLC